MSELPGPVEDDRPEICGFCFSEDFGFDAETRARLADSGKLYVTSFKAYDRSGAVGTYCGTLIADSLDAARDEAARRGLGETVDGLIGGFVAF